MLVNVGQCWSMLGNNVMGPKYPKVYLTGIALLTIILSIVVISFIVKKDLIKIGMCKFRSKIIKFIKHVQNMYL